MRKTVFNVIKKYYLNKTYLNHSLANIDHKDINKITLRVYGIIENKLYLEYLVSETTSRKKLDLNTQIIIMMSIYELLFIETPLHVVISEMQKLTKSVNPKSLKYISFYLHNLLPSKLITPRFSNEDKNLSIIYSIPQPIIKLFKQQYPDCYLDIIKHQNKKTYVRIVSDQLIAPELLTNTQFDDLKICNTNINQNPDFINHNLVVQDLGAYLVTKLLAPQASDKILDVCAAPGNKTLHIYKYCQNVFANELHEHRYNKMQKHFDNYHAKICCTNFDATSKEFSDYYQNESFDKILVDAPCSGLGVIHSKPEIKYQITPQTINSAIKTQRQILTNVWPLLKPGGVLVYATCSINKQENEDNIDWFKTQVNCSIIDSETLENLDIFNKKGYILLPYTYQSDGFYMVGLKKNNR